MIMRKLRLTILILILFQGTIQSQIEEIGIGYVRFTPPVIHQKEATVEKDATPFKFAELIEAELNILDFAAHNREQNSGILMCHVPEAKSLNAILHLSSGEGEFEIFVSNLEETEVYGPYVYDDFTLGFLPTPLIAGDKIQIKVICHNPDFPSLTISRIGYDFVGMVSKDGYFGNSGYCNIDVRCPEGADWQEAKRSVVRLIINAQYLCTGSIINNLRFDKRPFLLTANHCIGNATMAANTIAYFNYESPTCNGPDAPNTQVRNGMWLRATKNDQEGKVDFSLLETKTAIPSIFNARFAGWDASGRVPTNTVTIHHPRGDVKKISFDNDPPTRSNYPYSGGYDSASFWKIANWELGTTEGGSSGSPLFDHNQNIIGVLTGGAAACGNNFPDYYTQIAYAWDTYPDSTQQLKYWLNPDDLPTRVCSILSSNEFPQGNSYSDNLEVFPVPATDKLSFTWKGLVNKQLFTEIYDYSGRLVMSHQQKTPPDGFITINVSLPKGFYLLRSSDGDVSGKAKIIIGLDD
jgi:V8-like Glu-specific endopeptidase